VARGTQFFTMVQMLRAELGRSTNVAVGVDDLAVLKNAINKAAEQIADDYHWPHLRTEFDKIPLAAGQRYYALPTLLNYDRIEQARVWWAGSPLPIRRVFDLDDYLSYDSTNDERSSPAIKWDIRNVGGAEMVAIWPIPSSDDDQELQFIGQRKVARFVNDSDLCPLDDWLVIFKAATGLDIKKSQFMQGQFAERLATVRANTRGDEPDARMGVGIEEPTPFKNVTIRVR
jgi:hypothetical protein